MILVMLHFCIWVNVLNKPVERLRKLFKVALKLCIPVLWLPCAPPKLASGAVRVVVSQNHGTLTLPAMEGFPGLLTGIAAVEEVVRRPRLATFLTEAGLRWIERALELFLLPGREVGFF